MRVKEICILSIIELVLLFWNVVIGTMLIMDSIQGLVIYILCFIPIWGVIFYIADSIIKMIREGLVKRGGDTSK